MFSYFEPNFIEKFLWESCFFQILAKIEMARNKIGYLAAILKRQNFKKFLLQNYDLL